MTRSERTLLLVFAVTLELSCRARRPERVVLPAAAVAAVAADPGRFPHARTPHAAESCETCHEIGAARRLGHDRCAHCHAAAFADAAIAAAPKVGALCGGCHEGRATRALPSRFSHRLHLDRGRMEDAVGFHVACEECHASRGAARAEATHEACEKCHAKEATPTPERTSPAAAAPFTLSECGLCHTVGPPAARARKLITSDLRFSHAPHERDRAGRTIACEACHAQTSAAQTLAEIGQPGVSGCASCHDDTRRAPPEVAMARCETCHLSRRVEIPPRSHRPGEVAPADHTLSFRRDHAEAASEKQASCASCHAGMSGSVRDNCAECHAVMRPRDHTLTFRLEDHGRDVAATRDRCATCHAADFCEACHRIPPRSHSPLLEWVQGHGSVARLSLRSCFACHTFEASCTRCHQRELR